MRHCTCERSPRVSLTNVERNENKRYVPITLLTIDYLVYKMSTLSYYFSSPPTAAVPRRI